MTLKYSTLQDIIFSSSYLLQWKPLNVINLGQNQTDNINRMITIGDLV
jgi:hypothetical protein